MPAHHRDPGYRRRGPWQPTSNPLLSVMIWRLRPLTSPAASKPRIPPLSVVFTDWLSITRAAGLASRPAASRAAMRR